MLFYGEMRTKFNLSGLLDYFNKKYEYLFLSFKCRRAVINTICSRVNFSPVFVCKIVNVYVIFLFRYVLNTTEHKDVIAKN